MGKGFVCPATCRRVLALLALGVLAACGNGSQSDAGAFRAAPAQRFVFTNGDFENDAIGTMPPSGWTLLNYLDANGVSGTASAPPSSFSALNLSGPGTGFNGTSVVGGTRLTQADPDLGTGQTFRFPLYGQRSARLNYKDATTYGKNKNANVLRQSMTVSLADVDPTDGQIHVRFAIAPVLENPSHSFNQQPYFYVELLDLTRGTTLYTGFNTAGQTGVPWHTTTSIATGNATQWLDWALVDISPGNTALSVGDQVQLTVVASGCSLGGHFGRVYLDGMGSTVPGPYVTASAPQSVSAGATLTYTLRYANGGTTAALGAHVDQVTPPNTTFASVSGIAGCTTPAAGSAGTISCPIGTLNPGASGSFTITVNVAASTTGKIINGNYSIASVNEPTLLGAKVTTSVNASTTRYADIVVVKTASVTAVQPGAAFTSGANNPLYTITITNNSTTDQIRASLGRSVTFTDVIPSQLTGVTWACTVTRAGSGTGANPTKCRDQGGAATFNGTGNSISLSPRLGFNGGAGGGQLTINVFGTISATASGTMVNTAGTSAPSGTTDPDLTNNSSTVTVFVGTPRTLTVTKAGGNANGSVSSAPAGLSCGTSCGSASGTFADGSQVVLSASPIAGASFTGWSGTGLPSSCTAAPAPPQCTLTISGNMNVTATFAAPPAVGAPATVFVYSGNNQLTSTGTAFGSPLAVLVTDSNGTPVPSTTVSFAAVPAAGGASATLGTGTATTNASGIATRTATANSTPGTYTVNATVSGVSSPATFTLTNVGPPASITYVNGGSSTDPQLAPINTQYAAPLVAVVRDAAGNSIPGATVTYTAVPASGASCTVSNGSSSGASVSATADSSGMSSVTATANATVGAFTVTASASGVATPATFHLQNVSTGPAAVFIVSGNPQTAPTGSAFANPLVVVVADASGNSLPGITVSFAAQTGSSGATATLSAATAVTDASGLASVTATANATGGVFTVAASVTGVSTPATFTLTNDGGQTIEVQAGSPQTATVGAAFGSQLQALVLDGTGAAVLGAVVTFQAPTSGATATLSGGSACVPAAAGCMTATTNAAGIASLNATANSISGPYTVAASTPNAPTPASFDLTNQCTADAQCTGMTPICDSSTRSCVACGTNAQCSTKNASQPWCDASGSCFACIADSQCSGTTPICSQATNSCAACTTDAQCSNKDPANPYCLPAGTCFAGYDITSSAGANGTVSPSGTQIVAPGATLAISIAPAANYHVANVLVDGSSVGAVTSYTFTNVAGNHTLAATFAIDQFAVTASSGPNGTLTCSSPVDYGQSSTCTIAPAAGYQLATLTDGLADVTSQVVAGSYLVTNVTAPRSIAATFVKSQGTSCGGAGECATGHCVDGVCCDRACGGQCEACDVAGSAGTCSTATGAPHGSRAACASDGTPCGGSCDGTHPAACTYPGDSISCRGPSCATGTATLGASCNGAGACPTVQTQACAPFTCGATACSGNCSADSDCTSGNWCSGGVCAPLLAPGVACGGANQCGSQHCVDGVCCDTACTGQCEACAEAGTAGTCTPVAGTPRNARTACASDGSVCGGACDGTQPTACAYPAGSTTCRAPSCSSGVAVQAASCNGAGSCPAEQDVSCSPFTCGPTSCAGNCTVDSDCVAGNYCAAGICTPRNAPGVACGGANQCASGQCVDGVCCATACNGQCQACDVPGSAGTCTNVVGAPHGARQACASDGSACAGVCDGSSATACAYPAAQTICRGASCAGGVATLQAACDGAGRCPARQTQGCSPYLCGPQACLGNCGSNADCVSGDFCSAGICQPLLANGGSCAGASQCASGQCIDGVCCNAACGGQCQACDVPGQVGTCTDVAGAPHGSRQACTSGSCSAGVCTAAAACSSDAECGVSASCVAGQCQPKGKAGVWAVAGSGGCASGGAGSVAPLLAMVLVGLWRAFRRRAVQRRTAASAVFAAVLAASAAGTRAQTVPVQPQFNADRFNPGAGSFDILSVGSASVPEHLDVHVSIFSAYARDPLRLIAVADSTQQIRLLHSQTLLHLGASVALFGRFELGLTLPLLAAQSASSNDLLGTLIAPGDGIGDVRLVPKAQLWRSEILAIALAAPVTLPTGNGDAFLSHGGVTLTPELRVELNALPVRLAASTGIVLRRGREFANLAVGNALTYGLAAELPFPFLGQRLAALATLAGEVELQQSGAVERPMELLAALRWLLPANLAFTFGGGPGLTNGYGTPRYRVFAGIGFDPAQAVRRSRPRPPPLVQDFPRPAPAPVPPPVEPEPPLPALVAIAEEPPPLPSAAAVLAVAPTPGLQRVVRNGHLALLAQVQFAHDAATILPVSLPLLDQVVKVLRDTPEIRKVRIEGHTDGRGKPAYNRRLSQRRAESVLRQLVAAGIGASRLRAKGFGPDRPLVPNDTVANRAKNRRVEFVVLDGPKPGTAQP